MVSLPSSWVLIDKVSFHQWKPQAVWIRELEAGAGGVKCFGMPHRVERTKVFNGHLLNANYFKVSCKDLQEVRC